MGIMDWFKSLLKVEEVVEKPSFQEEEAKAAAEIGAQYEDLIVNELTSAFDTLQEEEDELGGINAEPAPNYDVGETTVDDLLLEDKASVSYYGANTVDAKIEGSDTHLKGVAILGDISTTVEEAVSDSKPPTINFSKMKKAELVKLAKDRGVSTSGTKAEIVERLQN